MTMSNSVLLVLSLLLGIGNYADIRFFFVYGVVDEYRRYDFPSEFVFGAGTSAYQVFLYIALFRVCVVDLELTTCV